MKIVIGNSICQLVIGGPDYLVDPSLQKNIRDYMSIDVPGAFHSPQFKKRVWDGKKYYCTPKGKVPTGMLPVLLGFLDEEYPDLEAELVDERNNLVTFPKDWDAKVGDYSMDGDYEHQLKLAKAYDHSITYRDQVLPFPRGVVDAATNAGKTTIIAGIFRNAICDNKRMLILIHRKAIYTQLVDFMGEVFSEVGQINDKFYEIKDVTVAMVQSLANRVADGVTARQDIAKFPILVTDECHRSSSKQYKSVFKHSDAYCRVFMSGSALDSNDPVAKLDIIAASGPKLAEIKKVELMEKGISTPVSIHIHLCSTIIYAHEEPVDYTDYLDQLVKYSSERLSIIHKLVRASTGPTIIAVDKIEHGQYIFDRLDEAPTGKKLAFTNGQDPRQLEKIKSFKAGEIDVLISTAVMSEGINLPNIKEIIYTVGGKSKISVKQWCGREERLFDGMENAILHDFWDVGPYVAKHSEARLKVYRDEELPVLMDFDIKFARKMKLAIV